MTDPSKTQTYPTGTTVPQGDIYDKSKVTGVPGSNVPPTGTPSLCIIDKNNKQHSVTDVDKDCKECPQFKDEKVKSIKVFCNKVSCCYSILAVNDGFF